MQGSSSDVQAQTPEQHRIAQLESELATTRGELQQTKSALERLREQYRNALEQLQLIHRRLFVAKAERSDASADQLAFDKLFGEVQALEKVLDAAEGAAPTLPTRTLGPRAGRRTSDRRTRSHRRLTVERSVRHRRRGVEISRMRRSPSSASRSPIPSSRERPSASASRRAHASATSVAA